MQISAQLSTKVCLICPCTLSFYPLIQGIEITHAMFGFIGTFLWKLKLTKSIANVASCVLLHLEILMSRLIPRLTLRSFSLRKHNNKG